MNEPIGASLEAVSLWKSLKPLNCSIFDDFVTKAGAGSPKLVIEDCELRAEDSGENCFKMVNKKSGKRHGIMRMIT